MCLQRPQSGGFEIHIKIPSRNYTITVLVKGSDTIDNLKAMIQGKEGLFRGQQRLVLDGKKEVPLNEDERTLNSYNIQAGATIKMFVKGAGGAAALTKRVKKVDKLAISRAKITRHLENVTIAVTSPLVQKCEQLIGQMSNLITPAYVSQQVGLLSEESAAELLETVSFVGNDTERNIGRIAGFLIPEIAELQEIIDVNVAVRDALIKSLVHQYTSEYYNEHTNQYDNIGFVNSVTARLDAVKEENRAKDAHQMLRASIEAEFKQKYGLPVNADTVMG